MNCSAHKWINMMKYDEIWWNMMKYHEHWWNIMNDEYWTVTTGPPTIPPDCPVPLRQGTYQAEWISNLAHGWSPHMDSIGKHWIAVCACVFSIKICLADATLSDSFMALFHLENEGFKAGGIHGKFEENESSSSPNTALQVHHGTRLSKEWTRIDHVHKVWFSNKSWGEPFWNHIKVLKFCSF